MIFRFLFILSLCFSPTAAASGMRLHLWVAELTLQEIKQAELRTLLSANDGAYNAGAVFPDTGYVISHDYGEIAHWSKFLNAYFRHVVKVCPYPQLKIKRCQTLLSHFFGSLNHSILDIRFDRHIVKTSAQMDFQGSIEQAQSTLDPDLDFIAIFEQGRSFDLPHFTTPVDNLFSVLSGLTDGNLSRNDLLLGGHILAFGYGLEPIAAALRYPIVKNNLKHTWAYKNYEYAKGGVFDGATLMAKAYDLVWSAYIEGRKDRIFYHEGAWPNVDFYINGNELDAL
jgi:hypothetical protein